MIIIKDFQTGIAKSPLLGFQEFRGLNITDKPGLVYPNKALTKESSTTVDDFIEWFVLTSEGEVWGYTRENNNYVFKRATNGTWSELTGHDNTGADGITFWKGYVGIIQNDTISWYKISDDSNDNWGAGKLTTRSSADRKASIHAQDDYLYISADNVIDKIEEDTTFVPATEASFTITKAKLTLPADFNIHCMEELEDKMLIGGYRGPLANAYLSADIYVWDRSSTAVERVLKITEEGVWDMLTIDNLTYFRAGRKGRWYVTNGHSVNYLGGIPTSLLDLTSINLVRFGQAFNVGDLIYFPVGCDTAIGNLGLYSINIKTGAVNFEHIISANETGVNDKVWLGGGVAVGGSSSNIIVSWHDANGSAFGCDDLSSTGYTSDRAFFISQWYQAGYDGKENNFNNPIIKLSQPLASGDSLKVYYREALNGGWTEHYVESTVGFQEGAMPPISDIKNIQFKVILNQNSTLEAIILE